MDRISALPRTPSPNTGIHRTQTSRCGNPEPAAQPPLGQGPSFAATIAGMRANDRHAADVRATQIKQSGAAGRLTLQEIDASDRALASAVAHSAHRFSDPHTVGAIRDTLFDTLHGSQTFRSVLAWSLSTHTSPALQLLQFKESGDSASCYDDAAPLHDPGRAQPWLQDASYPEAYDDTQEEQDGWCTIWVDPPPSQSTPTELDAWKTELVFQVVRAMTAETDGEANPASRCGVAALLAEDIAYDMRWTSHAPLPGQPSTDRPLAHFTRSHPEKPAMQPPVPDPSPDAFVAPSRRTLSLPIGPAYRTLGDGEHAGDETAPIRDAAHDQLEWIRRKIATEGEWDGLHGDLVPLLITYLYPDVALHITIDENESELQTRVVTNPDDVRSHRTPINLRLERDHYSYQGKNKHYDPPRDGDCFYSCVLYALNGRPPTRSEIRDLRADAATCASTHREQIKGFIPWQA